MSDEPVKGNDLSGGILSEVGKDWDRGQVPVKIDTHNAAVEDLVPALQGKPEPLPPEKRTWADYMARPVSEMLEEALEYVKTSVDHPEDLRGIVVLFNPADLHKPADPMTASSFEVYMGRAKATDPEVIFLARYMEQDVFLHFIGVRT